MQLMPPFEAPGIFLKHWYQGGLPLHDLVKQGKRGVMLNDGSTSRLDMPFGHFRLDAPRLAHWLPSELGDIISYRAKSTVKPVAVFVIHVQAKMGRRLPPCQP